MKKLTGIGAAEYARRRKQLMQMAGEQAILILPAAPERVRSHDTHYPYRQDSDFWYLSGFPEPEAVLVLVPGRKHGEAVPVGRVRDGGREAWDGPAEGQGGAVDRWG
ncbi:aminopeptidase P N-terminal domain-containing protein, partial [Xanthomonas perforans]